MSKAGEFVTVEKLVPAQMQTMTNRDFINRIYILRYEDCVESIKNKMYSNDKIAFLDNLSKLYWSFVVPRKHGFEDDELSMFDKKRISDSESEALLEDIAMKMHKLGVNRPEKEQDDPSHAAVKQLEAGE